MNDLSFMIGDGLWFFEYAR